MRDFTGHQKSERILDTRIVRHIDEPLVDDFCAGFRGDVRAKICGRLADRVDVSGSPRNAGGIGKRRSATVYSAVVCEPLPLPVIERYNSASDSTASASWPFAPLLSIATIEPMISR